MKYLCSNSPAPELVLGALAPISLFNGKFAMSRSDFSLKIIGVGIKFPSAITGKQFALSRHQFTFNRE
jgi:hypothetical protein